MCISVSRQNFRTTDNKTDFVLIAKPVFIFLTDQRTLLPLTFYMQILNFACRKYSLLYQICDNFRHCYQNRLPVCVYSFQGKHSRTTDNKTDFVLIAKPVFYFQQMIFLLSTRCYAFSPETFSNSSTVISAYSAACALIFISSIILLISLTSA